MTIKAPPLTEKLFQRQVVELAKIFGWRVHHPFLSKWSERGFPDLTMVRATDRRLVFAELKRDKARATEAQDEWIAALRALHIEPDDRDTSQMLQDRFAATHTIPTVEVYLWRPADWSEIERVLR